MILNATQQQLWAAIYAAEYTRLAALASAERPRGENWQYGSALAGDACARAAALRADAAVKELHMRSVPG